MSTYGLTETGSGVVYDGRPLDGVEVAVRQGSGAFSGAVPRRRSQEGEILVRAPMLFRCYRDGTDGRVADPTARPTGSPPETPGTGPPTGGWSCRAAWRTSSRRAQRRCGPISSNASCAPIPAWPRWRSGSARTPSGVNAWWPGSCRRTTPRRSRTCGAIVADAIAPWAAPKELVIVDDLPRTAAGKVRRRGAERCP